MLAPIGETASPPSAFLGWWLSGIACAVGLIVLIGVLLPLHHQPTDQPAASAPSVPHPRGRGVMFVATALSTLVLVGALVGMVYTL